MKTKQQVKAKTEAFFRELIEESGTYYLSDCVEEFTETMTEKDAAQFIRRRNGLKFECEQVGLNIHQISCDIATDYMKPIEDDELLLTHYSIEEIADVLGWYDGSNEEDMKKVTAEEYSEEWENQILSIARTNENFEFLLNDLNEY